MDVSLIAVTAEGARGEVRMKRERLVIGRKDTCDVRVPVAAVSREHCELVEKDGKVLVRDLGSSNGTYVNRERIQEAELKAGDLVAVGPAIFVVRIDGEPDDIDAEKAFAEGSPPQPVASASPTVSRPPTPAAAKPASSTAPTKASTPVDDDLDLDLDPDDSSMMDFDALLDDDEDEQPKL